MARWTRVKTRFARLLAMVGLAVMLAGCGDPAANQRAAFVLVDISGDYAGEMDKARTLTNYLLAELNSGDSLSIAFIDNSSFSERNIIARAEFDHRPSVTTDQKRQVRAELDAFLDKFSVPSYHSDITGGVLLASDYLAQSDAGHRAVYLLSNLHEDLMPEMNRDMSLNLEGMDVVAVNVTRERSDNFDPQAYQSRLTDWQQRVEDSGGRWHLANDLERLEDLAVLR